MGRPRVIPEIGDVSPAAVAVRLGLDDVRSLQAMLPELQRRGFPKPDPTTGNFCIEAVDRWRRRRHPELFGELTGSDAITDPAVMRQRLAEHMGGRR